MLNENTKKENWKITNESYDADVLVSLEDVIAQAEIFGVENLTVNDNEILDSDGNQIAFKIVEFDLNDLSEISEEEAQNADAARKSARKKFESMSFAEQVLFFINAHDDYDEKVMIAEAHAMGNIEQDYSKEQTIYTLQDGSKIIWEGSDWSIA